jgi:hypothetical protein
MTAVMGLASRRDHEDLQADLARFMREAGQIVAVRFQLPHGGQQIDVLTIAPYKYSRPDVRAYEVKVSRSDFLSDTRAAKWTGYTRYANRVLFACEAGLLKVEDVPAEAGLIVRGRNGWSVVKTGQYKLAMPGWDNDAWMALVSRKEEHARESRRLSDRVIWEENAPLAERAKNLGWKIAARLAGQPREEGRGERLWKVIRELCADDDDMSEYQAEAVLRWAFAMEKHATALREIGEFLGAMNYDGATATKRLADARKAMADAR